MTIDKVRRGVEMLRRIFSKLKIGFFKRISHTNCFSLLNRV